MASWILLLYILPNLGSWVQDHILDWVLLALSSLYYNKILFYLDFFFTDIDLNKGSDENFVQEYIANPFLVDQRKFDIGIYTVLTSIDPLRVYVYDQEVLIRYSRSTNCYIKGRWMVFEKIWVSQNFSQISWVSQSRFSVSRAVLYVWQSRFFCKTVLESRS